jgi:UDP-glucose-4-epimerase GalE
MVRVLGAAGADVVVVDDLRTGDGSTLPPGVRLVRSDVASPEVARLLREERPDAVLHFAGRIQVGESMREPRTYYRENLVGGLALLEACLDAGVPRFVLSSTAAVYGSPIRTPIDEAHPLEPLSPYGETKLALERAMASFGRAHGLAWMALRYFNAAGAAFGLAERHEPETHLVPLVVDAALGRTGPLTILGDDWPTPDGTCIRDYVHVVDLADAHLRALEHLARGGASQALNLGTGQGSSVREVVQAVERVSGLPVPTRVGPRRPGDPAVLVASAAKAEAVLSWRASRSSLEQIAKDAWASRAPSKAS